MCIMWSRKRNFYILVCVALILLLAILSGCPAIDDWDYVLPNNYCIVKINVQDIVFGTFKGDSVGNNFDILLERYIIAFCYDERYIGLQRFPISPDRPDEDILDVENLDTSLSEYYLVDSVEGIIHGPFPLQEYFEKVESIENTALCDWIFTADISGSFEDLSAE